MFKAKHKDSHSDEKKDKDAVGAAICKAEAFFKDLKCKKQLSAEWNKRRSARTCTGEQQKPAGWSERPRHKMSSN